MNYSTDESHFLLDHFSVSPPKSSSFERSLLRTPSSPEQRKSALQQYKHATSQSRSLSLKLSRLKDQEEQTIRTIKRKQFNITRRVERQQEMLSTKMETLSMKQEQDNSIVNFTHKLRKDEVLRKMRMKEANEEKTTEG
ncbi:hypothetical protein GEMRC1_004557 [Eukaryota sp. GEM-RC1]